MRTELELKCELQLVLGLLLGTRWSAIGQFFSLSLGGGGGRGNPGARVTPARGLS